MDKVDKGELQRLANSYQGPITRVPIWAKGTEGNIDVKVVRNILSTMGLSLREQQEWEEAMMAPDPVDLSNLSPPSKISKEKPKVILHEHMAAVKRASLKSILDNMDLDPIARGELKGFIENLTLEQMRSM